MSMNNKFFYVPLRSAWHFVLISCLYLAVPVLLAGCGSIKQKGESDTNYSRVVRTYIRPVCAGRAIVMTPDKQDDFIYSSGPETFTGGAVNIEIPLGKMIRNRAEDVFDRIFSAAPKQNQSDFTGAEYVITPVFKKLTYRFSGAFSTPVMTMALDMEVIVKKADGTIIYREQFRETSSVRITEGNDWGEAAAFGLDRLVFNIMLKAANKTALQIASAGTV